jgi:hypothetical protein
MVVLISLLKVSATNVASILPGLGHGVLISRAGGWGGACFDGVLMAVPWLSGGSVHRSTAGSPKSRLRVVDLRELERFSRIGFRL